MSENMTTAIPVKEIVANYLRLYGYDGLCCPAYECGCFLGDLMPCDGPNPGCVPGYAAKNDDGDDIIQQEKPRWARKVAGNENS